MENSREASQSTELHVLSPSSLPHDDEPEDVERHAVPESRSAPREEDEPVAGAEEQHESLIASRSYDSPADDIVTKKKAKTKAKKSSRFERLQWKWECATALLSVACMIAILIILLLMHGRPLARWKLPISPNALVSIFATIAKSSMLLVLASSISQLKWLYFQQKLRRLDHFNVFDGASRGPLGSITLMYSIGLGSVVALIAAFVVVLTLAMDPFVQQVIAYPSRSVSYTNVTATISRATTYDSGVNNVSAASTPALSSLYQNPVSLPASDLMNSLALGLFSSDTQPSYSCTSNDCVWPGFDSLGVCSSCNTTTAYEACSDCMYKSFAPDPFGSNQYGTATPETLFVYAGPFGDSIYDTAGSTGDAFSCASSVFARISIISRQDTAQNWGQEPAHSCTLSLCRKTYATSNFSAGALHEAVIATEPLVPWLNSTVSDTNAAGLCAFSTASDMLNVDPNATYWINPSDLGFVGKALQPFFWSSLLTTLGANNFVASALYRRNGGDILRTIDGVATSMTNQIRNGPNTTQHIGTALSSEVYIHVSWPWLVLPVSLVLLSIVVLAATILASSRDSDIVWKSSAVATMFHGVNGLDHEESALVSAAVMEETAKTTSVRLQKDDKGRSALMYMN